VVDIAAGLNAYEAILEALIGRGRSGEGAAISVSMFDAMAEWMTVPLLNEEGGNPFKRIGLAHPTIAPYGVFKTRDGADILISIQNDREWRVLADKVLGDASLGSNQKFATGPQRQKHRSETDAAVALVFAKHDVEPLMKLLAAADIAFARVNDAALLTSHPHLRRISFQAPTGPVSVPAPASQRAGETRSYGAIPALGEHSEMIRKEFSKR
jgi:formyl-CoA transferase